MLDAFSASSQTYFRTVEAEGMTPIRRRPRNTGGRAVDVPNEVPPDLTWIKFGAFVPVLSNSQDTKD
jgi:hypothetical protein